METTAQTIDIAWILVCAALVMLMQAGFSCLESGLVRTKNSINKDGLKLIMCSMNATTESVFELSGISKLFPRFETEEEALARL